MEHASKKRDGTLVTLTFTSKKTFTQTFRSKFKHSEVHFNHMYDGLLWLHRKKYINSVFSASSSTVRWEKCYNVQERAPVPSKWIDQGSVYKSHTSNSLGKCSCRNFRCYLALR